MKPHDEVFFVKVDQNTLLAFLNEAKNEIVIAKAGYRENEVKALLKLVKNNIKCKVFIDPDDNAVKWGLGDESSLNIPQSNCDLLNVQTADSY